MIPLPDSSSYWPLVKSCFDRRGGKFDLVDQRFQAKTQLRRLKIRGSGSCFSSGDILSQREPDVASVLRKYRKIQQNSSSYGSVYLDTMRIYQRDMAVNESCSVFAFQRRRSLVLRMFQALCSGANNLWRDRYGSFCSLNNSSIKRNFLR